MGEAKMVPRCTVPNPHHGITFSFHLPFPILHSWICSANRTSFFHLQISGCSRTCNFWVEGEMPDATKWKVRFAYCHLPMFWVIRLTISTLLFTLPNKNYKIRTIFTLPIHFFIYLFQPLSTLLSIHTNLTNFENRIFSVQWWQHWT